MASLQGLQGEKRGENDANGPRYVNTIFADKTVGCVVAYAVAMALYERERSGRGQAIEVPMFETMVSFTLIEHMAGETFCPARESMGYERVLSEHRKPYRTKDGYIGLLPYTAEQWARFFEAAGRPEMAADPRVTDPALRSRKIAELYGLLAEIVAERTTAEWVELLRAADLPMTPVRSPEDLLNDEHLQALGFFQREEHPSEGEVRTIGIPVRFSRTPGDVRRLAPRLNEHREEILMEATDSAR
jgi:crotonobetainyl-CoA:carnitine CoA-transferase CaiB-like acyl-CoA transferase